MKSDQARTLIRQTFTQAFDKTHFREFALNLLNHIDEGKASAWNSQYVKNAFRDHVQSYERLGTYTSPGEEKIDILIVHLTAQSKLQRARTALRNFVADHLKRRDEKDAALVAFVSPSETTWRFSYVKMEYATVEKDSGTVGAETRLTPARRFSYLVGEGESCHTAQSRFIELLQNIETNPSLSTIEAAFSVEAVTRAFFEEYAGLFTKFQAAMEDLVARDPVLRDEFKEKGVNPVDFSKKLMGQVVFLYFLQKKGWLGVAHGQAWGSGPRDFLRQMANGRYGNFFNDLLEPLFYDTLATDRGHDAWCSRFQCRIPFLNGGLFEPLGDYDWKQTDIILPNTLFTNADDVDEGGTGTGVLDVFDRYNFTVNEAEPLEKEVAIDPEMLGKVFENLLEENRRKGLGAYYTPREIVHYMCQESLINYLDTVLNKDGEGVSHPEIETFIHLGDQAAHYEAARISGTKSYKPELPRSIETRARLIDEKLADIAICDPAVGSGAFPVGMMTEIVRARSALTPYFNDVHERTPYHFKRHAIQNCLYGVDIDSGAVEIAKLRLWLSLVVDEDDPQQIKPLPNLDYKIVAGNSLIRFPFKSQRLHEIERLKARFFEETDHDRKAKLKQEIERNLKECFASSKKSFDYEVNFDFEIYFSEVFDRNSGFDVVIANPPYVRQEKIKDLKPALKAAGYECFDGVADLLVYFYERGVTLLRSGGAIALITSNKFYRAGYGEKLRGFLARELTLRRLIDFGDAPVFEAIAYASILTGVRTEPPAEAAVMGYTWEKEAPFERIAKIVPERGQEIRQSELKPDGWRLESPAVFRLLEKLRRAGKPLGEYVNGRFYYGIKTGLNEAFVVDRATRDRLIAEHPSSADVLKPFLRGRDVKRWRVAFADRWLIKIESSENVRHPWSGKSVQEAENIFARTYSAIHARFEVFRAELTKRDDQGEYFWELRSCAYWQEFEGPKIILGRFMNKPTYAFDRENYHHNDALYMITGGNGFVVAVLNSSVSWWFLTQLCTDLQNGYLQAFRKDQFQVPIPAASPETRNSVERLVDRILDAKQREGSTGIPACDSKDPQTGMSVSQLEGEEAKQREGGTGIPACDSKDPQTGMSVSQLEREIDRLVYGLYGLTPEEIHLVEGPR